MPKYDSLNKIPLQDYSKASYGTGDKMFSAITVHSLNGKPFAVELPIYGLSGSNFYKPDPRLLAAIEKVKTDTNPGVGRHVQNFVRAVLGDNRFGAGLVQEARACDTATNEGCINAMNAVFQNLNGKNLGLSSGEQFALQDAKAAIIKLPLPEQARFQQRVRPAPRP